MRAIIYPYKLGSQGAAELAAALNTKRVRSNGNYRPRNNHLIINWGNPRQPIWWNRANQLQVLNNPANVATAINKLRTFEVLTRLGVSVPLWTADRLIAQGWRTRGSVILARQSLTGSRGSGIVLVEGVNDIPQAPLYTKHVRHKREFRVHVLDGTVIDVAEKRRRADATERNSFVRSHHNGWVFCHDNVQCPDNVKQEAVNAVLALGLQFGAVDIGYREKENQPFVFEVNSAPGIEGTTVQQYADAIRRML